MAISLGANAVVVKRVRYMKYHCIFKKERKKKTEIKYMYFDSCKDKRYIITST